MLYKKELKSDRNQNVVDVVNASADVWNQNFAVEARDTKRKRERSTKNSTKKPEPNSQLS